MKFKYRRFVSESSVGSSSSSIRTSSTSEESDNDDCANISDEIDDENYNHPHDDNGKLILLELIDLFRGFLTTCNVFNLLLIRDNCLTDAAVLCNCICQIQKYVKIIIGICTDHQSVF